MTIELSKVETHIKELTARLEGISRKLIEAEKMREELVARKYALIGALESSNSLKDLDDKKEVEVEKDTSIKVDE